jgi:hypothetical protein
LETFTLSYTHTHTHGEYSHLFSYFNSQFFYGSVAKQFEEFSVHSRHLCALTRASQTPMEQVQRHGTFFAPVLIDKSNDADLKKFTAPLATLSNSVLSAIVNLCIMYKNAEARGVCTLANCVPNGQWFTGFSQDGGREAFLQKISAPYPFYEGN